MLRIILSLFCFAIFAFANSCDFSDKSQKECELDIDNPPIFLHKFVDSNNNVFTKYSACVYDGKFQYEDEEYDVIDCSLVQDEELFTEGILLENKGSGDDGNSDDNEYALTTNKEIALNSDNIMLIVAGDLVLDSGIRINSKNPKNFIIEIIEGSNGKANLILNRGAKINANAVILPSGPNSSITLNTFFGGEGEKDFIDTINSDDIVDRGDMDTNLTAGGIYATNQQDASIIPYDGDIICGPEVNPFDLDNKEYLLKRLTKNDDGYDIDIANLDIDPNYGLFIESGKVVTDDSLDSANIQGQNSGECNAPMQLAFSQEEIDAYNTESSDEENEEYIAESDEYSDVESSVESQIAIAPEAMEEAESSDEGGIESDDEASVESNEAIDEADVDSSDVELQGAIVPNEIGERDNTSSNDENAEAIAGASGDTNIVIIERDVFDKFTKLCNGDMDCLNRSIEPYKNVIWNKISSQNNINSIYIVNLTGSDASVQCEVVNYYGENIEHSFNLSRNNMFGKIDLKFPKSSNDTKIVCQSSNLTLETNAIQVNPAKFDITPIFGSEDLGDVITLKAGVIDVSFEGSKALNLEGEIDTGFNAKLVANNEGLKFTQNKCGYPNDDIFIKDPIVIGFKDGKASEYVASFMANTITYGDLSIDFDIEGDYKKCGNALEPKCSKINITKNINVIPSSFMIKTDIISPYKIAYYGQLEDRGTFKYNPMLNIQLSAVNNNNEAIDINQACNHGVVELSLDSQSKIEFKRSITDRLNSKINIYLDDFADKQIASVDMYFGISKIANDYGNTVKINQGDLIEPKEIKLTDLEFYIRFKSNGKTYSYDDLVVYDRLAEDSTPVGVLFARGKIEKNISYKDDKRANLDLKYLIYCQSCDTKTLEKYLSIEGITMDSPNWYLNREHPSDFYLSDDFIKTDLMIDNSNRVVEGVQQIVFDAKKNGIYDVLIKQRDSQFAPYLNYNKDFKNIYLENAFSITIEKPEEAQEEQVAPPIEQEEIQGEINDAKPIEKPKPATKKPAPPKSPNAVELDIEE